MTRFETLLKELAVLRKRLDNKLLTENFVSSRLFEIHFEVLIYCNKYEIEQYKDALKETHPNYYEKRFIII